MRLSGFYTPALLVPLGLLTPYVPIGHYYISILEILVLGFAFIVLGRALYRPLPRLPSFFLAFLFLYTVGYLGALLNGLIVWGVPAGPWNLNFFYKLLIAVGAFWLGAQNTWSMERIFSNSIIRLTIFALGALMLYYPLMDVDMRLRIIGPFWNDSEVEKILNDPRMPGLGINNVVYAMMFVCWLIVAFQLFLQKKISVLIPLVLLLSVLSLASKLAIGVGAFACAILFVAHVRPRNWAMSYRNLMLGGAAIASLLAFAYVLTQTPLGEGIQETYATVQRLESALDEQHVDLASEGPRGFEARHIRWAEGIKRVALAPLLGIGVDPFGSKVGSLVGFYTPHNEWIRLWTLYGLAGMLAWVLLLASLFLMNLRGKVRLEWIVLYGAFLGFMLYDGGVDSPRFVPFWFYLIGLNYSLVRGSAEARMPQVGQSGSPAGATPQSHATR